MTVWADTIVELEPWELLLAATEAGRRWAESEARAASDRGGVTRELDKDVAGVCGELAVAKWTRRYWTAGARGSGDVGGLEVRTRRADPGDERPHLLIQPYDERNRNDSQFVLVVGQGRTYRIVGSTTPREARRLVELGGATIADPGSRGRPCIAVPQLALVPVDPYRVDEIPTRHVDLEAAS